MQLLCNKIKRLFWQGGGILTIVSVYVLESMLLEEDQLRGWVSPWVMISVLSVHVTHFCCLTISVLYLRRNQIYPILASTLRIGLFLELLLSHLFPQGLRGFLHGPHMCLFPIHVFHPLRALSVFVFLKSVIFFSPVLAVWNCEKHKRQSWHQRFLWWGERSATGCVFSGEQLPDTFLISCSHLWAFWNHHLYSFIPSHPLALSLGRPLIWPSIVSL